MNEVITKLNEIEEKAQGMIDEAKAAKETMQSQLAFDQKELDERYAKEAAVWEEKTRLTLLGQSREAATKRRAEGEQAIQQLEEQFEQTKEQRVEVLFQKLIQES